MAADRAGSSPEVSVVIPTWNQSRLVAGVLRTLHGQTFGPAEMLVVDNGSTDDTAAVSEQLGATVIRLFENRGFAAAVNAGILKARFEWLFLLNNDVNLDPKWLEIALKTAHEFDADFVTGKLLQKRARQRLDGTYDLLARSGCAWRCGWNAPDHELWNQRRSVRFASFTALLIRRSVFEKIGLLDTRYESYYEDVDFGLRAAIAGCKGIYEPCATGTHLGSATLGAGARTTYLISRNQVLLAAKFGLARLSLWKVILGQSLFLLSRIKQGTLVAALKGKWNGLRVCGLPMPNFCSLYQSDRDRIRELLDESEAEIRRYQRLIGFDLSWKWYFALSGRRQWPES
jgi:GT2 family glycosyltransferase